MRKFILSCIVFLLFSGIVLSIIPNYWVLSGKYKVIVAGNEIYHSIFKSKQKKKSKKILLGDSVCYQLFPNTSDNGNLNSLACNQAISMVGQFILLNNYLNAGNKVDTVCLIYTPFSFLNNLDQEYTYHYFLKPFYINEYKPLLTKKAQDQIEKIPYFKFCRFSNILASNWAPNFVSKDTVKYSFLSPISIEYLVKMKKLSIKHNFTLVILPTPTALSKKLSVEKMDKNEISNNNLEREFKNYFKSILYLNDSFFIDGKHFKHQHVGFYTKYYEDNLI
jgi:hypothetical protein